MQVHVFHRCIIQHILSSKHNPLGRRWDPVDLFQLLFDGQNSILQLNGKHMRGTSTLVLHTQGQCWRLVVPCGGRWFGGGSGSSGGGVVEYCVAKIVKKSRGSVVLV